MSAFYDLASLVVVPSGYKSGKIYAQKPLTTDGQLAFSRASEATRVGPDGLIEKVRTNLVTYSEDMVAGKTAIQTTVTNNFTTAPNGTTTAAKLENIATGSHLRTSNTFSLSTFSFYAKYESNQFVQVINSGNVECFVNFDIQNGVIGTAGARALYPQIESVGSGWYRCSVYFNTTAVGTYRLYMVSSLTDGYASASVTVGSVYYTWGWQIETSDIATDYIATTSAAVSVGPVANVPRLDYLGSSCGRLLLEPQRQNLKLYSESFSNAAGWSPSTNGDASVTFTANYGVSPDGYTNADRLQLALNTGSFVDWLSYNAVTIGTTYTYSIYAKSLSGSVDVEILGGTPTGNIKKTITTEWTRLTTTFTATSGDLYPRFLLQTGTSTSADILIWGAQLEAGAYATSYIPTLGASVTRGADACSKTGISSLIGQTEGTLFAEIAIDKVTSENRQILQLSDGSGNNLHLRIRNSNDLQAYGTGNFSPFDERLAITTGGTYKIAFGYANGDFAYYVNGVQIATDTQSTTASNLSEMYLGINNLSTSPLGGSVSQTLLFKTRLTNAQLAELTTL